jgi:hypothetical protein
MKYFAHLHNAQTRESDRFPVDGRLSLRNMRREGLRRAQRVAHYRRYTTLTIERESTPGNVFARTLPEALRYPIQTS